MSDTNIDVATVTRCSTFERSPAAVGDPDLADLDRLDASLDHLMSYRYQPGANQTAEHPVCEAVSKRQRFGGAMLGDEQL